MPRLFVAVELPQAARSVLVRLQPAPMAGLRLPESAQMHLTLHYIGESDPTRMSSALEPLAATAFSIDFQGVGQFPSPDGSVTLWTGVNKSPDLLALHGLIGAALAREGFVPEARPYTPHVTIARCGPGLAREPIEDFLKAHSTFSLQGVQITEFGLYSSAFVDGAPSYRREQAFGLT
jgi:RNA 2',3'-cyclic 3'-phosphodiesterase